MWINYISKLLYAQWSRAWHWRQPRSPGGQFFFSWATLRLIAFQRFICRGSSGQRLPR